MNQGTIIWKAIKTALSMSSLSCNPRQVQQYYDKRASTYNEDVAGRQYCGPEYIVSYFTSLQKKNKVKVDLDIRILDAGCGTGLVGIALYQKGYRNIDGFDLSQKMIEKAKATGVYRSLKGGIDITQKSEAYKDGQYDATICCGVFVIGLVPPSSLEELIRVTKSGGLIVMSTRKSYYDNTTFQTVCNLLQKEGAIKLIDCAMDCPYLAEEDAHYWAFAVC